MKTAREIVADRVCELSMPQPIREAAKRWVDEQFAPGWRGNLEFCFEVTVRETGFQVVHPTLITDGNIHNVTHFSFGDRKGVLKLLKKVVKGAVLQRHGSGPRKYHSPPVLPQGGGRYA